MAEPRAQADLARARRCYSTGVSGKKIGTRKGRLHALDATHCAQGGGGGRMVRGAASGRGAAAGASGLGRSTLQRPRAQDAARGTDGVAAWVARLGVGAQAERSTRGPERGLSRVGTGAGWPRCWVLPSCGAVGGGWWAGVARVGGAWWVAGFGVAGGCVWVGRSRASLVRRCALSVGVGATSWARVSMTGLHGCTRCGTLLVGRRCGRPTRSSGGRAEAVE